MDNPENRECDACQPILDKLSQNTPYTEGLNLNGVKQTILEATASIRGCDVQNLICLPMIQLMDKWWSRE